jgi:hypothetical protein
MNVKRKVKKVGNTIVSPLTGSKSRGFHSDQRGSFFEDNVVVVSLIIGVGFTLILVGVSQWLLPLIFGVSGVGLVAQFSSRLAGLGGIAGSIGGYVGEMVGAYSTYILQPAMNFNSLALFALIGTLFFAGVIIVNTFAHEDVIR